MLNKSICLLVEIQILPAMWLEKNGFHESEASRSKLDVYDRRNSK